MYGYSYNIFSSILLLYLTNCGSCIRTIYATLTCVILNEYMLRHLYDRHFYVAVVFVYFTTCRKRQRRKGAYGGLCIYAIQFHFLIIRSYSYTKVSHL